MCACEVTHCIFDELAGTEDWQGQKRVMWYAEMKRAEKSHVVLWGDWESNKNSHAKHGAVNHMLEADASCFELGYCMTNGEMDDEHNCRCYFVNVTMGQSTNNVHSYCTHLVAV